MAKFNYYAKGECPVCSGAGHKSNKVCRSTTLDDGRLKVHCWAGGDAPTGWGFIGDDTHGMAQFVEGWKDRQTVDWAEKERKATEARAQAERERLGRSTPSERDATYRRWQDSQRLNQQDRDELSRRGLLPDEIQLAQSLGWLRRWTRDVQRIGPANIPGVNSGGVDGLAIAAPNTDGLIAGFQIKPDHQGDGPKYRWLAGCVLQNDEQPVPVFKHPDHHGSVELWITEGFLKSLITAFLAWRHGLTNVVVVGCGGSNWASYPKQLRATLDKLTPTAVHFLPDAGAFKNANVKKQIRKLQSLMTAMGYPMLYRWWHHWNKDAMDPDEVGIETIVNAQLLCRFPGSMGFGNRVAPAKVTRKNPEINTAKDLLQRWTESTKRFVCDGSPTATGKNYSAGLARPEMFTLADGIKAQGLWFITDDARNPSTPTLQAAPWVTIEGRHGGLVLETDVDGTTVKRRMKPGDDNWDIQPNCSRNGVSGALRSKNIDGDSSQEVLCRACPKFGMCVGGGGPGYGYLYARYAAMKMSQRLINPNSLPSPDTVDLDQDVAIVDEFGEKSLTQTVTVSQSDVEQAIAVLAGKYPKLWNRVAPMLRAIQELTESDDLGYHGLSHHPILERLGGSITVDEQTMLQVETALQADLTALTEIAEGVKLSDLPSSVLRHFTYSDKESVERIQKEPLQWLGDFWRIATGRSLGLLSINNWGRITMQIPDQQLLKFLQACGRVIFLDATLPVEHLAAWLGCAVDDIDYVAVPPSPSPVKIMQVKGLGRLTRNRSQGQLERLERAIAAIKHRHPGLDPTAVIDFKGSDYADAAWWRDTRGSNAFKDIRLTIAVGTPIANLNGMSAQYMAIYGEAPDFDSGEFQLFANETLTATFTQAMGRKAGRRGQTGDVMYFITEEDGLEMIARGLGMDFATIEAGALGDGIGDQGSQTRVSIARSLYQGHDRQGCAHAAGVSGSRVSQVVPTLGFGGGFKESSKKLASFNSGLIKGTNLSQTLATYGIDAFKQDLRRWLSEIQTTLKPLSDPVLEHLRQEVDAWGCAMAFGPEPPLDKLLDLLQDHGEASFREAIAAISPYSRAGLEAIAGL